MSGWWTKLPACVRDGCDKPVRYPERSGGVCGTCLLRERERQRYHSEPGYGDKRRASARRAVAKHRQKERHQSVVYFVRAGGLVKIGITTHLMSRITELRAQNAADVELFAVFLGARREEQALHALFRSRHHHGEWFREDVALLAEGFRRFYGQSLPAWLTEKVERIQSGDRRGLTRMEIAVRAVDEGRAA